MAEKQIGVVDNYFSKIGVAAIKITEGSLSLGDRIMVKGATSDFTQVVESMQVDHKDVETAEAGDLVGIKVIDKVRGNDTVYLLTGEE
jgi:putative protease